MEHQYIKPKMVCIKNTEGQPIVFNPMQLEIAFNFSGVHGKNTKVVFNGGNYTHTNLTPEEIMELINDDHKSMV
jgi:hypothetical protein